MTQEDFFGFLSRPFQAAHQDGMFVPNDSMELAIRQLASAARKGDGIGVLTAVPGAGKSVVCRQLQSLLADEFLTVLLPSCGFPTRRALLQAVLYELGQDFSGLTEQEARLQLLIVAQQSMPQHSGILLIVDEAHQLNPRLLEELRCLTNHIDGGVPLIRVILSGQLALEETLTLPELQALNYRITAHMTLEPLSLQESAAYISGRLKIAGGSDVTLLTPQALEIICRVSDGSPRCLNQIADACLTHAAEAGLIPVDDHVVRTVLLDLKQLPLQWNESVCDQLVRATCGCETKDDRFDKMSSLSDFLDDEFECEDVALDTCAQGQHERADEFDDEPGWMSQVTAIEVGAESHSRASARQPANDTFEPGHDGEEMHNQESDQRTVIEVGAVLKTSRDLKQPGDQCNPASETSAVGTAIEAPAASGKILQELPVVDRYAVLDRHREAHRAIDPTLAAPVAIDWKEQNRPSRESFDGTLRAITEQLSLPPELEKATCNSRIGRMIQALTEVVANELAHDQRPSRVQTAVSSSSHRGGQQPRVSDERPTATLDPVSLTPYHGDEESHANGIDHGQGLKWRSTPDPLAYDIIQPEFDGPASEVRVALHKVDDPAEHESEMLLDSISETEQSSDERPYARLFSRLRRQRTPA